MKKYEIVLLSGEGLPEFTDQLKFILMELGVKFGRKQLHDDYMVFEFEPAERLEDKDDGKKQG
jgi:hypothetical protein